LKVRLQKFLADAGVASRRASEALIVSGRVRVNGQVAQVLGTQVDPDKDSVKLDGRRLHARRKLYLAIHKPAGYLCTCKDPENRPTCGDLLPAEWAHLYPVGRLDFKSEGLIFLTNDGDFCLRVSHPRYNITKKYTVIVVGEADQSVPGRCMAGIDSEEGMMKALKARIIFRSTSHTELELELSEGKNREVRRMMEALGLEVRRLVRTQIGPIKLAELPRGKWRTLTNAEVKSLIPDL
jgi:23S rRNA pseudouridine2605 synthase